MAREQVLQELIDDGVYDTVGDNREVQFNVGDALCHRRCKYFLVGDFKAAKEVALFGARCLPVATPSRDRRAVTVS